MNDRISALIDGELSEDEAMSLLARLRQDAPERATWDAYHLIGDAIRGDLYPSCQQAVAARLLQEPTVLAPRTRRQAAEGVLRYALSAAAGISGVVFVLWAAGPAINASLTQQLAVSPDAAPARVAVMKGEAKMVPVTAGARGVENYLFAHQQTSSGLPSVTAVAWTPDRGMEGGR